MIFHRRALIAECGTIIPLKFIESMLFIDWCEAATSAKLAGDSLINVVTTSGNKYSISCKQQAQQVDDDYCEFDAVEFANGILELWINTVYG